MSINTCFDVAARPLRRALLPTVLCILLVPLGCGEESGPKRYQLSGTVTYQGDPVPAGSIIFLPDTQKGNSGPAGTAEITDGKYDTSLEGGKGIVGGVHVVEVIGFDGVAVDVGGEEKSDYGKRLFNPYRTTVDFPNDDTTQDFEVPVEAGAKTAPPGETY